MIQWDEKFATGHGDIDSQHRMLFQLVNDMEEVSRENRGESYLKTCFPYLEAYAKAHFGFEEDCMFRQVCPAAEQNRHAHKAFLTALSKAKSKFESEGYSPGLLTETHRFLEDWIKGHILAVDTKLKM